LDLGKRETSWCEVRDSEVIARGVIHELAELESILGESCEQARVAFEASREALHVYDWISARGHTPVVVDTTRVRQMGVGSHGRKNDRIDAECLAVALERGYIAEAHVLSPMARELREHLESHRALTGARAQMIVHARGLASGRGVRLPACETDRFARNIRDVKLPKPIEPLVTALVRSIEEIQDQLADVDARIDTLLTGHQQPVLERLASVHGVSLMVVATFMSVIDDPHRFRNASAVVAYLGLCPSERSTGGRQRLGGITKHGNAYARALLVQAAWCILRSRKTDDPLVHWAHRVSRRRGRMRAAVAVARRLARILWAMWRDGRVYDPTGLLRESEPNAGELPDKAVTKLLEKARRNACGKLQRRRRQITRSRSEAGSTTA
jgi:transposase